MISEGTSDRLQTTKYSRGTEGYRAPELVMGPSRYSNRVDIWSMGCVLYELVSGRKPFGSDWEVFNYYHTTSQLQLLPLSPISESEKLVLSEIVQGMLELDPSSRPTARSLIPIFASQYESCRGESATTSTISIISVSALIRAITSCTECGLIATVPWAQNQIDLWEAGNSTAKRVIDHRDEVIFWDVESGINVFRQ